MGARPVQIFVSYSRQDQDYLEKGSLLGYLRGLEREGASFWIDTRRLGAGDEWDQKIRAEIARSEVALLLVSQTFLDSDYCHEVELPGILEESEKSGMVVVSIILSACGWLEHPWIPKRQVLPGEGKNIESDFRDRGERKELFHKIRTDLKAILDRRRDTPPAAAAEQQAARRQVTVMQCELTAAPGSRPLELEEQAETAGAFAKLVAKIVGEAGQPIEREGNALVCYFGYPQARGNDARQAVHAALEILDRAAVYRWWPRRERRLAARIGIHTGWLVATPGGPLGSSRDRVWGVRSAAEPDTVVVSDETFQLIRGFFTCRALDSGVAGGPSLYTVRRGGGADNRFDLAATGVARPMVGRKRPLETLLETFDRLLQGHGGSVLITGEHGLGKSRLVRRLTEDFAAEDCTWLIGRGARDFSQSAFRPVHDFLQDIFHFSPGDAPGEKRSKLEEGFEHFRLERDDLPLLCQLLSIPAAEGDPPLGYSPSKQLERTRQLVLDLLLRLAGERPLVVVLEDLDWIDSSTLALLEKAVVQASTSRMLVLLTCTPQLPGSFEPPESVTRIALDRLSEGEVREMLLDLTDDDPLPGPVVERIVERAGGLPLWIEELVRSVRESSDEGAGETDLPANLDATLSARFERLSPAAKDVVRLGSVLGRQFSFALLDEISPLDASELAPALGELAARGLVYSSGSPPRSSYLFKHPLIRRAAYRWLPAEDARQLHRKVAEALAANRVARERQPEVLAHHFTEARCLEEAAACRLEAGEAAWAQLATAEAEAHLTKGLDLVRHQDFPAAADSRAVELELLTTLGYVHIATKGHAAKEVEETFLRSRQLVRPELFEVNWGLANCYMVRADLERAYGIAGELVRLAELMRDPALEIEAHTTAGQILSGQGENAAARRHLEKALELVAAHPDRRSRLKTPQDSEVAARSFLGVVDWLEGHVDEALDGGRGAILRARRLGQPFNVALALNFSCFVLQAVGRARDVHEQASEMIALSIENGFPQWQAMGAVMDGWARVALAKEAGEKPPERIAEQMAGALGGYRESGARLAQSLLYALLIDAWVLAGDLTRARAVLDEAFRESREVGDRFWHAELHRLAGEIRLARAPARGPKRKSELAAAEEDFQRAVEVARRQGAVSLELRAAKRLS